MRFHLSLPSSFTLECTLSGFVSTNGFISIFMAEESTCVMQPSGGEDSDGQMDVSPATNEGREGKDILKG